MKWNGFDWKLVWQKAAWQTSVGPICGNAWPPRHREEKSRRCFLKPDIKKEGTFFYVQRQFFFCQLKTKKGKSRLIFFKKNKSISHICSFSKKEQQIVLHFVGRSGQGQTAGRQNETLVTLLTWKNCPMRHYLNCPTHRADLDTWTDRDRDTNTRKRDHETLSGHTKQQNDIYHLFGPILTNVEK